MTNKEKIDQLRIQYKEATSDLDRRLIQIRAELLKKTSKETARPMKLIEDTPPVEYSKNDLKDLFWYDRWDSASLGWMLFPLELLFQPGLMELMEDWYQSLLTDCKAILVEGEFVSRWSLIETYHEVGKRILVENDNFRRKSVYGKQIARRIGKALNKSERTINYAVQFAKKYPVLDEIPMAKNASWTKVVNELLPENPKPPKEKKNKCPECGHCW